MPFAVTHVILTMVVVGIFRDFFMKHKFSTSFVVFAGLAGLLPDADIALGWILNVASGGSIGVVALHRIFTHSVIWGVLLAAVAVIAYFALTKKNYNIFHRRVSKRTIVLVLAILSAGWLIHLSLDCALAGDEYLSLAPGMPLGCPQGLDETTLLSFDAIILLAWLFWEQHKHRIIDYV